MADSNLHGHDNVVSLMKVMKDVRFPMMSQVETYWNGLRGTRTVPARSEVDPRRIEDALEYAFILERIAPGIARFRLAGMHLNDLMGMEVRGMPLTAFFMPDARAGVSDTLESMFSKPATARLQLAGDRGFGKPPLDAELMLLPLKSDFGDVNRALGCLATLGPIGRVPRRFSVKETRISNIVPGVPAAPIQASPAETWREKLAETKAKETSETVTSEFAEDAAEFDASSARTGVPYLRLVKSDD